MLKRYKWRLHSPQNSYSYVMMLVFGRELSCNKFGSAAYKKVLTMQSMFIKKMEEMFPWFNVDNISITTPTDETKGCVLGGGAEKGKEKKPLESAKL